MHQKHRYVVVLALISVALLLPGAIAHLWRASESVLHLLALIPMLASLAMFLIATPVTLYLTITALLAKEWKRAGLLVASLCLPLAIFYGINVTNRPGFDCCMSV